MFHKQPKVNFDINTDASESGRGTGKKKETTGGFWSVWWKNYLKSPDSLLVKYLIKRKMG